MKALVIPEAVGFEGRLLESLLSREAENHLMIGITGTLVRKAAAPGEERFFWAVMDDARVLGGALWTPPFKPVLTRLEEPALEVLFEAMASAKRPLNGVSGPGNTAERFAGLWGARFGGEIRRVMGMRIRECRSVMDFPAIPGRFRHAVEKDLDGVLSLGRDFHRAIGLDEPVDVAGMMSEYVKERRLFLWEEGGRTVSMAGWTGPTPHGARMNFVYTPPEHRGRGYSKACVAGTCRWLLGNGRQSVFLFSDVDNPVSNRVYDQVGFKDVCDWEMYEFAPSPPPMGGGVDRVHRGFGGR